MITITAIDKSKFFKGLAKEYYRQLTTPLDGMWETAYISNANQWQMNFGTEIAGYFCVDANRSLLVFNLFKRFWAHANAIFDHLLAMNLFDSAVVSTGDSLLLSLSMERQHHVSVIAYLFEDYQKIKPEISGFGKLEFRQAVPGEEIKTERFFQKSLSVKTSFRAFVDNLIHKKQLYFLFDNEKLIATGELRKSASQPKYADLGMIVDPEYRNRGVGRYVLTLLKSKCYQRKRIPICSTETDNFASRKAIENAGFISRHRLLAVAF